MSDPVVLGRFLEPLPPRPRLRVALRGDGFAVVRGSREVFVAFCPAEIDGVDGACAHIDSESPAIIYGLRKETKKTAI